MTTLTINGKEVSVEPGTTIIEAAEKAGFFVPHYCYHASLSIAGSCRLCLVELEGAPREVIACGTPVSDGMAVYTDSDKVKRAREIILEFLLLNHPLDCPVCDKAGECLLQNYSFEYGTSHSRFDEPKRVPPFKDLGPNIKLATTRCILCTRCTRFMEEIAGEAQLTVVNRGFHNEIAVAHNSTLDHPLAGNVVDICPVGALLDKNFIHRTRVWHLTKTPTICGECSAGCNTFVDSFHDSIYRIVPRINEEVNGHWICDTGRYSNKKFENKERLTIPKIKAAGVVTPADSSNETHIDTTWDEAIRAAADGFMKFQKTKNAVAGIISPGAINEDAFAVMSFLKSTLNSTAITGIFQRPAGKDRVFPPTPSTAQAGSAWDSTGISAGSTKYGTGSFIIKGDTLPNQEGLRYLFGLDQPDHNAETVLMRIESGEIKAVYCVHTDLSEIPERTLHVLKRVQFLVVEDIFMSSLVKIADVVFPGTLYLEKTGTFVNYKQRLQLLQQAVNPPEGTKHTWSIVKYMAAVKKQPLHWFSSGDVFMKMAKRYPELEGLSHFKLKSAGKQLFELQTETEGA